MSNNTVSDDQALEALLSTAHSNQESKVKEQSRRKGQQQQQHTKRWDDTKEAKKHHFDSNNDNRNNRHVGVGSGSGSGGGSGGGGPQSKRRRRWNKKDEEKDDSKYQWGDDGNSNAAAAAAATNKNINDSNNNRGGGYYGPTSNNNEGEEGVRRGNGDDNDNDNGNDETKNVVKQKPNFGLSGALAEDEQTGNIYNGVVLKFTEPPEARTPNTRWRFYVFKKKKKNSSSNDNDDDKDNGILQTMHISRQSAYLFGRERKVADIPVDHPSLSKQHCVLQYRVLPDKNDREQKLRCKPYLMDLGSTNGTFINGVRIDDARYYELRKGDVITLGASTREYVLMTENTVSTDLK